MINSDKLGNIFLGIGRFHLEKVIIDCCRKNLEESGIDSVFLELEMFGIEVVYSVIGLGNNTRGEQGIVLISEALQNLQFPEFIETINISKFSKMFVHIAELQTLFRAEDRTPGSTTSAWKCCQNEINEFNKLVLLFIAKLVISFNILICFQKRLFHSCET